MTERNAVLAYETFDLAKAHWERLNMEVWASSGSKTILDDLLVPVNEGEELDPFEAPQGECGTVACYAGWVVAKAGYAFNGAGNVYATDGTSVSFDIESFAGKLLNIGLADTALIFWCDREDLEARIEDVFGPRPTTAEATP